MHDKLKKPWLLAVWPGMGGVAQIAGGYLTRQLDARPVAELEASGYFEPSSISIKQGLVQPGELPHSRFFAWKDPKGKRDLLLMLGEQQPSTGGFRYAEALLEYARTFDIERVVTFAAMAAPIHPSADPRVFAACTQAGMLPELLRPGITLLQEGEISGLNGVFLAAAAARDLPSVCLLGEFPFFAAAVPNPKASAAVLRVFSELSGIPIDLTEILSDASKIESGLVQHLEKLQASARAQQGEEEQSEFAIPTEEPDEPEPMPVPRETLEKIEKLFVAAKKDRRKALELKAELDRNGLFERYEDRFLDLFKHAG